MRTNAWFGLCFCSLPKHKIAWINCSLFALVNKNAFFLLVFLSLHNSMPLLTVSLFLSCKYVTLLCWGLSISIYSVLLFLWVYKVIVDGRHRCCRVARARALFLSPLVRIVWCAILGWVKVKRQTETKKKKENSQTATTITRNEEKMWTKDVEKKPKR